LLPLLGYTSQPIQHHAIEHGSNSDECLGAQLRRNLYPLRFVPPTSLTMRRVRPIESQVFNVCAPQHLFRTAR